MTRNPPAIRDFFDIWYAKNFTDFDFTNAIFKELVNEKLKEVNFDYHIDENKDLLDSQVKSDLMSVLN